MTQLRYVTNRSRPECPSVTQVFRYIPPASTDDNCLEILERFFANMALYALPVVDPSNVPVALIERQPYVEYFGKKFSHELYGKKTVAQFSQVAPWVINEDPLIVPTQTSIDDVANIIIARGMQHMVSGFIVTSEERYAGIANGHDLLNEITQRKQAELYYLAHYDQLTGIPNRMLFADRLQQACREALRTGLLVVLMFVDLDRFKQVNDSLGHSAGDHLLRAVAERLKSCARDCDTVARLGGDEFAIVAEGISDARAIDHLAQRIVETMREPFTLMEQDVFVTASVGVAVFPRDDSDVESLLAKADAAMFQKKRNGRNGFHYYTSDLVMGSIDRLSLETDLRNAIDNEEFVLHYQPQIDLRTGQISGVEALLRWRHPIRGMVSPGQFIEIAEDSGLILPLGIWVLQQACRQARIWRDSGLSVLRISVNVSALQFAEPDFCKTVEGIVREAGIEPSAIELELTERIVMHHASSVQTTLECLKRTGVQLAIDDFGTGFSSLSYLRRFPIDRLKIDQSFIRGVDHTPVNESIVRAIVALAKSLSLKVTAEGAETPEELDLIMSCGCDEAQGFHFLRPCLPEDFSAWLQRLQPYWRSHDRDAGPDNLQMLAAI